MNSVPVYLDPVTPYQKKKKIPLVTYLRNVCLPNHFPCFGNLRRNKEEMQGSEAPKLQHLAVRLFSCQELVAEKRQSRSAVRNIARGWAREERGELCGSKPVKWDQSMACLQWNQAAGTQNWAFLCYVKGVGSIANAAFPFLLPAVSSLCAHSHFSPQHTFGWCFSTLLGAESRCWLGQRNTSAWEYLTATAGSHWSLPF